MAEPQVRLITNSTLTVWANAGRTHRYPCGDGLYFQARPTRASWVFRFRFGGARRAMGLGAFPEVAREKADRARLALREGRDPIAEQKAAATQAQAQERTTLRQEYIALRQKVTVLEQELAQQRAMAKRFLGNKAADVPSGKVTEFRKDKARLSGRSIATHFPTARHWPCDPPPQPLIPDEVPAGALQAIEKEWKVPFLNENVRAALERLATDPRMLTEVWEKLPRDPDGLGLAEYSIIQSAVGAFGIFPLLRPKPWSRKRADKYKNRADWKRYQQHLVKYQYSPGYDWLTLARWACDLRNEVAKLRDALAPTSDEMWSDHWRGDPAMNTTGAAISFLDALFHCFVSIAEGHRSRLADMRLPTIARWDDEAPQRFFGQVMSGVLKEFYNSPYYAVVDALTAVMFGLPVGPGSEKVYGWCRMQGQNRAEN